MQNMLNIQRKLKVYSYNDKKLNIKNEKIEYINIKKEEDIRTDLLNTDRIYLYLDTYLVLLDTIQLKNIFYGFSFSKTLTEDDLKDNLEDILHDQYDFKNLDILVFSYNKTNKFQTIIISKFSDLENYIENYPNRNNCIEYRYFYLIIGNEIRLYYNTLQRKYIIVEIIKKLKYKEYLEFQELIENN